MAQIAIISARFAAGLTAAPRVTGDGPEQAPAGSRSRALRGLPASSWSGPAALSFRHFCAAAT